MSYGATSNPFDTAPIPPGDSYSQLVETISGSIHTINTSVISLERNLKEVGTVRDGPQLRKCLHENEQRINSIVNDTAANLKRLSSFCKLDRGRKIQFERLRDDFKATAYKYNTLQKKIARTVKTNTSATSATKPTTENLIEWGDEQEEKKQLLQQEWEQEQIVEEEIAYLKDREQEIRNLEGDILDINEMFRDLGTIIHEQGAVIDTIEANVETTASNVEAGNEQLERAARYQRSARKKKCCLLVVLLTIIAVVVIIVVLSVKLKK